MIQGLVEFGFIGFPVNDLLETLTDCRVLPVVNMANHNMKPPLLYQQKWESDCDPENEVQ